MIVLNLQYHNGDMAQMMALARLLTDLEDGPRKDAIVMFTARFDTPHDDDTVAYVEQKFPVLKYTTKRHATGWPNGPNQMMGCSLDRIIKLGRGGSLPPTADAVMFIEADCVPLRKTWLSELMEEYYASGKMVSGAWLTKGDCNCEHINGNCIMSIDFWKRCRMITNPPENAGWDAFFSGAMMSNGHPSKLIWSDYQLGMAHNPWRGDGYLWESKEYKSRDNPLFGKKLKPCWFHGIKTGQGIAAVRRKLLGS